MSKRRNKKQSPAKAAIKAALEIAQQHAQLFERIRFDADSNQIITDREPLEANTQTELVRP